MTHPDHEAAREVIVVEDVARWIEQRWDAEVGDRPAENIHRRTLDNTWRQVYRKLVGRELDR